MATPRRYSRRYYATARAVAIACCLLGCADAAPATELTTVAQIRSLSHDEANRGYPVRLTAVVTYDHPSTGDMFVQDRTGGIFLNASLTRPALHSGDLLEVTGVTEAPDFAPQVGKPQFRVIGSSPLPKPVRAGFGELISSREDSQWVELEAIVRDASVSGGLLTLDLSVGGGAVRAYVADAGSLRPDSLIDARVRMQGVSAAMLNQKNQIIGVQVDVPGQAQVVIEEKPPRDPFALAIRPISQLLSFASGGSSEHRVHVRGTVTLQRERGFFIQDASGGLVIYAHPKPELAPGEHVDVAGFANIGDYTPVLTNVIVKRFGMGHPPAPVVITGQQGRSGAFDATLVRMT